MNMTGQPDIKPNQLWRHYKGGPYVVIDVALREADSVPVVVYRGAMQTWVRPLGEFLQKFTFEAEAPPPVIGPLELSQVKKLISDASALLGTI